MLQGGASAFPDRQPEWSLSRAPASMITKRSKKGSHTFVNTCVRSNSATATAIISTATTMRLRRCGCAGETIGAEWYPAIRNELLHRQEVSGFWADSICNEYGTAMALIILQIPNNYLPIFQR